MADKTFTQEWCKYTLTEKERQEQANILAAKTQEKGQVEKEKKAVMADYKKRLDSLDSEISNAAQLYKDGYEYRHMECEILADKETCEIIYIRTDNGEEVKRRKMTGEEKQLTVKEAVENAKATAEA